MGLPQQRGVSYNGLGMPRRVFHNRHTLGGVENFSQANMAENSTPLNIDLAAGQRWVVFVTTLLIFISTELIHFTRDLTHSKPVFSYT